MTWGSRALYEVALAAVGLGLSFMSSAAEAALFHLPRRGLAPAMRTRLRTLLQRPHHISDVLRTLDFFANVTFLFVLGLAYPSLMPGVSGFQVDVFLLLVGVPGLFLVTEAVPRTLGTRFPVGTLRLTLWPLELAYGLLVPLSWGTRRFADLVLAPLVPSWGAQTAPDEEELRAVLGYSARRGDLGQEGVDMVEGILDLDATRIRQIMTPRTQVVFLDDDATWEEALDVFSGSPYRRLPVKRRGGEEILGVLYAKDMLAAALSGESPTPLSTARPPLFVPGVVVLSDALARLREAGNQMAVVVDEYGGIEGVATMEDILEEIVGEIRDEHDELEAREDAHAVRRKEGGFDLDGSLEVEELGDLLGLDLSDAPCETLGGLVFHEFGSLPAVGDEVEIQGHVFRVTGRDRNRVARVLVLRRPHAAGEGS